MFSIISCCWTISSSGTSKGREVMAELEYSSHSRFTRTQASYDVTAQ